jgi:hypothetical protein
VLSAVAPLQDSRRGTPARPSAEDLAASYKEAVGVTGRSCSRSLHSEAPKTYPKPTPIIHSTKQNKTRTHSWGTSSTPTKTRRNVPPVSVPQPNRLNSRRFLRRHKIISTTECRCDLRRFRLFASEARNGLPKRTQGLATSAKPFLLLSWILLARPSKGKRRPLSSHMF